MITKFTQEGRSLYQKLSQSAKYSTWVKTHADRYRIDKDYTVSDEHVDIIVRGTPRTLLLPVHRFTTLAAAEIAMYCNRPSLRHELLADINRFGVELATEAAINMPLLNDRKDQIVDDLQEFAMDRINEVVLDYKAVRRAVSKPDLFKQELFAKFEMRKQHDFKNPQKAQQVLDQLATIKANETEVIRQQRAKDASTGREFMSFKKLQPFVLKEKQ